MLLKENISTIKYFYLLFLVSLFLFYAGQTLGLGVNDLDPNNDRVALSFKKDGQNRYNNFMSYNCAEEERLYVHLKAGEQLEFGFQFFGGFLGNVIGINGFLGDNMWVSIREEGTNNQVFLEEVIAGAPGFINDRDEAIAGPQSVDPNNGYDPFSFISVTEGDYYIEVAYSSDGITDEFNTLGNVSENWTHLIAGLYDFTITSPANTIETGRIWSKAWHILVRNEFDGDLDATQYIYTNNGIISALEYNGIIPYQYVIISNSTGVNNTNNFINDRQSITSILGDELLPEYKLFFDIPDTSVYKVADLNDLFGDLNEAITITGCPEDYCINVDVSKAAFAQLLINLNGIEGYQENSTDILFEYNLDEGANCIPWNGRDGQGNTVTVADVSILIEFVAGITHLPMFDVEVNPSGLNVSFIYPASIAGPTDIFWDDSNIGGTINDVVGCNLACHDWQITNADPSNSYGNEKIINSWWYIKKEPAISQVVLNPVSIDIGPDQQICLGDTITLNGPADMKSYSWSPPAIFSNPTNINSDVIPTEPTKVILTVINQDDCPVKDSLLIDFFDIVDAEIDPVDALCESGTVSLNASGGTIYRWIGTTTGLSSTSINNPEATVNTSVTYEVEVTSEDGCKDTADVEIFVGEGLTAIIEPVTPICEGEKIVLNASGGNDFLWIGNTSGLSSTVINNPEVDINITTTYSVEVSQGNCKDTASVEVRINQRPSAIIDPVPPVCIGESRLLNAFGGNSFLWINNTTGLSSTTINNPTVTITTTSLYTVEVTDVNSCKDTAEVEIVVNPLPTVVASNDTNTCSGQPVPISATGANTYVWSPEATLSSTTGSMVDASPTSETIYFVEGTDVNNCKGRDSVLVSLVDNLIPSLEITNDEGCEGDNLSFRIASSQYLGSNPPYNWGIIPNGTTDTILKATTVDFSTTELLAGDQVVLIAISTIECIAVGSEKVVDNVLPNVYKYPNLEISGDTSICIGENGLLTVIDLANVAQSFTWLRFPSNEFVLSPKNELTFSDPSSNGSYYVTASNANYDCPSSSNPVTIAVVQPFVRAAVSCPVIMNGETVNVSASTNTLDYSWTSSLTTGIRSIDSVFTDQPDQTVVYTINGSLRGCDVSDSVWVKVLYPFEAPYFFSPNGDGENDRWYVKNIQDYEKYTITLYNRWGNIINQYEDEFEYWDGANKGGTQVPDGVYYYVIKTAIKDKPMELSGFVTVAR